ncbi:MAG TPA: universal stress protein [Pseudonocardiaceae bacterium]|jgi:nucleotide-binding universal stress UspA family protein
MYNRILVAVDTTPDENNPALQRTEQFAKMAGSTVYLLHMARGHVVSMDLLGGSPRAVVSAEDDAENPDLRVVQSAVDHLAAAGIEAHGEMVSATEHDMAEIILQRAKELDVDLIVLGHEHHRGPGRGFRSSVAEHVIHQHPPYSILLARPPLRAT